MSASQVGTLVLVGCIVVTVGTGLVIAVVMEGRRVRRMEADPSRRATLLRRLRR